MSDNQQIQNIIADMRLFTEFLEACGWDEELAEQKINLASDIVNSVEVDERKIKLFGYEKWFKLYVISKLMDADFTEEQIDVIERTILSVKKYQEENQDD